MNKGRLLDLIDVLENKVTDEQFDIHVFMMSNFLLENGSCGTIGCAAGWYAFHRPEYFNFNGPYPCLKETGDLGYIAMEEYFDLTYENAQQIFSPSRYWNKNVTRKDVIDRINEIMETSK